MMLKKNGCHAFVREVRLALEKKFKSWFLVKIVHSSSNILSSVWVCDFIAFPLPIALRVNNVVVFSLLNFVLCFYFIFACGFLYSNVFFLFFFGFFSNAILHIVHCIWFYFSETHVINRELHNSVVLFDQHIKCNFLFGFSLQILLFLLLLLFVHCI